MYVYCGLCTMFQVSAVCHEAALLALQEDIQSEVVDMRHFQLALSAVTPRISQELIKFYESYQNKSSVHGI